MDVSGEVQVEEKLDGANLGFSVSSDGTLQVQNRGPYLEAPYLRQFSRLDAWLLHRERMLTDALSNGLILFGEWCAARHSIDYSNFPDWFCVLMSTNAVGSVSGRWLNETNWLSNSVCR